MISFVSFMRPVTFVSVGTDYWSATDSNFAGVTCVDKGSHLLFECKVRGRVRKVKVPLTNVSQVTVEEPVAEEKAA